MSISKEKVGHLDNTSESIPTEESVTSDQLSREDHPSPSVSGGSKAFPIASGGEIEGVIDDEVDAFELIDVSDQRAWLDFLSAC